MLPNEVVTECLKDRSNGLEGIDGDSLPPWIRRSITNPDTITCTTLQNTAPVQKRLTENICTWTLKLRKTPKYFWCFFLYFPKCPENFLQQRVDPHHYQPPLPTRAHIGCQDTRYTKRPQKHPHKHSKKKCIWDYWCFRKIPQHLHSLSKNKHREWKPVS